jgi:hypothetical protein
MYYYYFLLINYWNLNTNWVIFNRYEKVRYYLKQGLSAIEALRLGYEDAYKNTDED